MAWPTHIVAVSGLIEDGKGNVLLIKSARRKTWETCGGQVELGENLEQALIREVKEESHVDVSVRCMVGLYSNVQQTVWHDGVTQVPPKLTIDFICDYKGGEPRLSDETTEVIWCPREQALEKITHPITRMRIRNMLEFAGNIHYHAYSSQPFEEHYRRYF